MFDLSLLDVSIALVGGIVAGSMNALAGYGSIITLTILMDIMGLSPVVANASNRIGVLANGLSSTLGFSKNGRLKLDRGLWIITSTILGAILGIIVALYISNEDFRIVFKYLIVVLFLTILVKPKRWLRLESADQNMSPYLSIPIFFVIGFYGGFIQMGMGLIFLAAAVLIGKFNIIDANGLKVVAVSLYTLIGLLVFWYNGMLVWLPGLLLAVGQAIGGYFTASLASRYKNAHIYAYRILVLIVLLIIANTFFLSK